MEMPLCQATSALHPTVWVLIYLIPVIVGLLLLRYMWITRPVKMYHWRVFDHDGINVRVVARNRDHALDLASQWIYGVRVERLKYFLGQHIPDDTYVDTY